jgi:hypothetical protein
MTCEVRHTRRRPSVRTSPCWPGFTIVWLHGQAVGWVSEGKCESQYCLDEMARGHGSWHTTLERARAWVESSEDDRYHFATLDEAVQAVLDWQQPGRFRGRRSVPDQGM